MGSRRVVIIGGGIAGLSAAAELVQHGHQVMLLEARPRLGGRIRTVKAGQIAIELGAEFVHGRNESLWHAIESAKLTTHEVPDHNQFFEGGRLRPVELWDKVGEVFQTIKPRGSDVSVRTLLMQSPLDEFTRRLTLAFVEGFDAAHTDRISSQALLRAEYASELMKGSEQFRINEGYSALAGHLASEIARRGGTIITNAVVHDVRWQTHEVEVRYQGNNTEQKAEGDAAIVTLPVGQWKVRAVRFDPALPDHESAALALEFGNVVKITLVFRDFWWPDGNFGFVHAFDEPIPTWWSDPRGPVLTGWAGGPKADALASSSHDEIKELALGILARIFQQNVTSLRDQIESSFTHNWAKDPFSRGAYSYIPVNGLDLPKSLAAPVAGTLFFAGEATVEDAQMGTVFGAFESGIRAAREIREKV